MPGVKITIVGPVDSVNGATGLVLGLRIVLGGFDIKLMLWRL